MARCRSITKHNSIMESLSTCEVKLLGDRRSASVDLNKLRTPSGTIQASWGLELTMTGAHRLPSHRSSWLLAVGRRRSHEEQSKTSTELRFAMSARRTGLVTVACPVGSKSICADVDASGASSSNRKCCRCFPTVSPASSLTMPGPARAPSDDPHGHSTLSSADIEPA